MTDYLQGLLTGGALAFVISFLVAMLLAACARGDDEDDKPICEFDRFWGGQ